MHASAVRELADALSGEDAGKDIVIVHSERLLRSAGAARALLNLAARLSLAGRDGAGIIEIPSSANGRGLREAGFAPGHGPGYTTLAAPGAGAGDIAEKLAGGELSTLLLWHADPLRTHPDRQAWEAALAGAGTVIAYDSVLTESLRRHADVVFPAETYAEKEGTLTHPDGRVQRLRVAIGRPKGASGPDSGVRAGWRLIADIGRAAGLEGRVLAGPMVSKQLFDAVPFYAGLSLDEIGPKGVRWQERAAASAAAPAQPWQLARLDPPGAGPQANGSLRVGTFRSLWSSKEVDVSPALAFLRPRQTVELSPADAERLGVTGGDQVELGSNGTRVQGAAMVRAAVPTGSVFVIEGTRESPANVLTEPLVEVRRVGGVASTVPSGQPAIVTPAHEGLTEPRSSSPESPPGTVKESLNE
jgi:NADH-quinone oxidoreductase subunit G